jgi:hypothetical protein
LCCEIVMGNKCFNPNRHHSTIHPNFESKFPKKAKLREEDWKLRKILFYLNSEHTLFSIRYWSSQIMTSLWRSTI